MIDHEIRSGGTLDPAAVETTLRYIRPRTEELSWQAIPWRTSIPEALDIARREGKPVLLWTMNGNPLGCT